MWVIGARGSVAVTTVVGALALGASLADMTGCVTALPPFAGADLPEMRDLVFGGHDVEATSLVERADRLVRGGVVPAPLLAERVMTGLNRVERAVRPAPSGPAEQRVLQVREDLAQFRDVEGVDRIVVVNLASTEAPVAPHPAHAEPEALLAAVRADQPVVPDSTLFALAAVLEGCAYVNFTPSTGASLPAVETLARRRGVPLGGRDGKTGETLVKSALGPMFARRNLRVTSWSGTNLLGGGDGATLQESGPAESKSTSKQHVLAGTLGYLPPGQVHIDNLPVLGDRKTAWDLMTFAGFLGVGGRLQFTWEGVDSALAAPLVLDLVRLTARALDVGASGTLEELAFFFKDPAGDGPPHDLAAQWNLLSDFATNLSSVRTSASHATAATGSPARAR
ncbi:inositol-3-phosphate synthase [Actinomadura atramentaria]|uniref:inositol-3-phosphate synthase n=1 Tax=Actinomadura atramentaria TaxID=1990 RepID=UPI00037FF0AE